MDVLTPAMVASPHFCATLRKPHPHNYGRLTSKELMLIGACASIGFAIILKGKGKLGDDHAK